MVHTVDSIPRMLGLKTSRYTVLHLTSIGVDVEVVCGISVTVVVAPVAQLVTSKPSDTLGREFESR